MATIQGRLNSMLQSTANYYRPLFRSGSVKPLWHIMIATSVIMYSQNYIFNKGEANLRPVIILLLRDNFRSHHFISPWQMVGAHVQAARKEQKVALEEYYEKHGKSGHH
ncbi:hypothetical protein ACHAXT_010371 [Thalassiosira profunda]